MYQSGKTLEQTVDKQEVNERQMDVEVGRVLPKDSWQVRKQVAQWLLKLSFTLRCTRVVSSCVTDCGVYWSSSKSQNIWDFQSIFLFHDFQFEVVEFHVHIYCFIKLLSLANSLKLIHANWTQYLYLNWPTMSIRRALRWPWELTFAFDWFHHFIYITLFTVYINK